MAGYDFRAIEKKWQRYWEDNRTFRTPREVDPAKRKFYVLDMFPYPSGVGLHVGHPLGYIATDIVARYRRMRGFNVLHPMGFDAFGLPAEQYAVEHGVHPRITTERNIANMLRQLKSIGLSYDWDRVLATTDPGYYKWTQWIFLQIFNSYFDEEAQKARPISHLIEKLRKEDPEWDRRTPKEQEDILQQYRLAYIAEVPVNWCPALGTVLANEEVTNEGRSERGNYPVYKRPLRQWMMRITAYADRLEKDLDLVDWPEPIKLMQRNWIGRSEGAEIDFPVDGREERIRVFTTRPDTIFGATYMVLAPEHPLVDALVPGAWPEGTKPAWTGGAATPKEAVEAYRRQAEAKSDVERQIESREKTGVFTGAWAVNPATGRRIPVFIADYVLMGYGTGAIMAVPGQDERDWEFAEVFDLPIIRTVQPPEGFEGKAYTGDGPAVNSGFLDGLSVAEAKRKIIAWLEETGYGRATVTYKLRDWLFSRQRYWGEPFPILYAPDGRVVPVDEKDLPVTLPEMDDFRPAASDDPDAPPRPPLSRAPESWRFVEIDGVRYEREYNTMPQWAGSCWYYLRFIDNKNDERFVDPELERYWMHPMGVDLYVGGAEHAVLHLLYARFWHKVLYDLGHVSTPEPFGKLFNQGYIQAYAYRDARGVAVPADEVVDQDGRPATEVQDQPGRRFFYQGEPVTQEYGKMGKSLKNAVSPDEINEQYGCDTLRLYEMYLGPLEASKPWNTRDIVGVHRFLKRVWRNFVDERTGALRVTDAAPSEDLLRALHRTIARVTDDMERMSFNTAIAALIELNNALVSLEAVPRAVAEPFVLLLAPMAPHLAEELWQRLGHTETLAYAPWPEADARYLREETVEVAVQVNGKVRATIAVPADADKAAVLATARAHQNVARHLDGKTIRREIYVPGRIVNFVVG
ncbi:leucine--tRNA ligase [Rhodocaloribacter litoris]|uniref:leucine--tRNA ligase n=1 Tax=Rhodocaloribacter litoris TaxID=2558931 RepID=UPI00141EC48B|nr:leucine--tRNA ligase [Rhodocaloribacter litoris]